MWKQNRTARWLAPSWRLRLRRGPSGGGAALGPTSSASPSRSLEGVFGAHRGSGGVGTSPRRAGAVQVVHPLDKFCERKSINVTGPTDEGEELLVRCLKAGKKCDGFTKREFA